MSDSPAARQPGRRRPARLHSSAASDVPDLIVAIPDQLAAIWSLTPATTLLSQSSPRITFADQSQRRDARPIGYPIPAQYSLLTGSGHSTPSDQGQKRAFTSGANDAYIRLAACPWPRFGIASDAENS